MRSLYWLALIGLLPAAVPSRDRSASIPTTM